MNTPPLYNVEEKLYPKRLKLIPPRLKKKVEGEVKALLHASREVMRIRKQYDTTKIRFCVYDGYYGEAFGIMRGLNILGYGYFGSSNLPGTADRKRGKQDHQNLMWWFDQLEREVLEEEGYGKDNICEYCYSRYGRDTTRSSN